MKRKITFSSCFLIFTLVMFSSVGGIGSQELYAQEQMEDVVYFIDGSSIRGTIVEINREKVRILQKDGKIVELSFKEIQRFSSDRSFKDMYRQKIELAISQQDKIPEKEDWRAGVGIRLSYSKISDDDFEFDDTVSLGIDFTHYVSSIFSGEFSAEYLKTGATVSNFNIGDLTQFALLLTGRFHLPLKDGKILPYIGFGVGYYNNDFDESSNLSALAASTGSKISVSIDNSLGLHVKAGSEFFTTEHLALNLEVMYILNEADGKLNITGYPDKEGGLDLNTLKVGLGVKYFF
ncbi:OmpW family protein [Thermodesulfobacteriota bacterium]